MTASATGAGNVNDFAALTALRKDAADILVQKKCLPRYLVRLNSLTKAGLYSLAYLKRWLTQQPRDFLCNHIRLQMSLGEDFRETTDPS